MFVRHNVFGTCQACVDGAQGNHAPGGINQKGFPGKPGWLTIGQHRVSGGRVRGCRDTGSGQRIRPIRL